MYEEGLTETKARIADLEETLDAVRRGLRQIVPVVFPIHPDSLES